MAIYTVEVIVAPDHPSDQTVTRLFGILQEDSFAGAACARARAVQWALATTRGGSHPHALSAEIIKMEV